MLIVVSRKMRAISLVTFALLGLTASVNYEGYKVYKFVANTDFQNDYLNSLATSSDFDFWSDVNKAGAPVIVMVSPSVQHEFEEYLKINDIDFEIQIENVERTIYEEKKYHLSRAAPKSGRVSFDQYYRHGEINDYLAQLARDYPSLVTLENIGQSYQGRDMIVIRISTGSNPAKPVIFVEAGIHAREWISPAVSLYLINQLVENPSNRYLIENVDWIVLPVTNPDGYEYTWSTTRLWRKTLSPGIQCNGCDGNRNWDFYWMGPGASSWECSETYAGSGAFSEIETKNLRDYVLKTANIEGYVSVHSYGQYLLYPWGWTSELPANWVELQDLGERVNNAIRAVNGTTYRVGSSTNVLYSASGASVDWVMGVAGVDIVYTIELPGGGSYGFDLPASRIAGVAVETFEGFKVWADHIANRRK